MAERKNTTPKTKKTSQRAEDRALAKSKKIEDQLEFERRHRIHDEIGAIVCIACGVFLIFAMQTDKVGVVGSALKSALLGVFGRVAFVLPYLLCVYGLLLLFRLVKPMARRSLLLVALIFLLLSAADSVRFVSGEKYPEITGCELGDFPLVESGESTQGEGDSYEDFDDLPF